MRIPEAITVPEIIDLLGGPTPVGRALDVPSTTISNWKGRGSIPARYHADLIRISKGKLTAAMLAQAHKPDTKRAIPESIAPLPAGAE